MKKIRLILFLLLAAAWGVEAATITVSNDTDNPGEYDDLQAAVDAASAGDTILVSPSGINTSNRAISYGNVTINKKLTLLGPGINQETPGEAAFIIGTITLDEQGPTLPDASGTVIQGLVITSPSSGGEIRLRASLDDILIEKCYVKSINYSGDEFNNVLIKNNIIKFFRFGLDAENSENILFSNNIIEANVGGFFGINVYGNIVFRNNVFIGKNIDPEGPFLLPLRNMKNLILENNIFWAWEPGGCTECTFTNNLTYANFNNELIGENSNNPGSVGSGNIINQDPQFVNYDGGVFEYTDDFNLQTGSPAIGAGISGVDVGIYGGSYPWNIDVATIVPEVTSLIITESSVPEDGQLEFTFSAEKQ